MINKPKMPGRCPACDSTNIQAEPLYPYEQFEDDEDCGELNVFCVSCGHFLGEMHSDLANQMRTYRAKLDDWWKET